MKGTFRCFEPVKNVPQETSTGEEQREEYRLPHQKQHKTKPASEQCTTFFSYILRPTTACVCLLIHADGTCSQLPDWEGGREGEKNSQYIEFVPSGRTGISRESKAFLPALQHLVFRCYRYHGLGSSGLQICIHAYMYACLHV